MSYEHKDPVGPGAEAGPPTYTTPAPAAGYEQYQHEQQQQQHPIQAASPQQSFPQQPAPAAAQGHYAPNQEQKAPVQNTAPTGNVMPIQALTSSPAPINCPSCHQRSFTSVMPVVGNTTHAWALGVCACCCLGCIPYCISGTKDIEHKCGNCGVKVATWHRSGRTDVHMM